MALALVRARSAAGARALAVALAAAALALTGLEAGAAPAREAPVFMKGFTLGGWSTHDYSRPGVAAQLDALRSARVEWIALTPRWLQEERDATAIAAHPERTPSDESLVEVIGLARSKGFEVFLKPQVDVVGPGWRGEIAFASEDEWEAWFASYRRFISHYAGLARRTGVALFCVGVELDATRHREADWRRVIAEVGGTFPGPLTYAANWGRERDIRWWDALDYAGVDAYFPVAERADPPRAEIDLRWAEHLRGLRAWAERIDRPVLFTEIGYRSRAGAGVDPWEWQRPGTPAPREQERLYRAAFEALWSERWLAGLFWWQWRTAPPDRPELDTGFTPQGKPALDVVGEFYARESRRQGSSGSRR